MTKKTDLLLRMALNYSKGLNTIIRVAIDDYPALEKTIIPHVNIPKKMEYINNTYDQALNHKRSTLVKIVDFD